MTAKKADGAISNDKWAEIADGFYNLDVIPKHIRTNNSQQNEPELTTILRVARDAHRFHLQLTATADGDAYIDPYSPRFAAEPTNIERALARAYEEERYK